MRRELAIIRTKKWTLEEETLLGSLRRVFGDNILAVFHDLPKDAELPVAAVSIDSEWVKGAGLRDVSDWGWRCGDYFCYRAREARPDYDHYWMIEPDVYFDCDVTSFFARFEDSARSGLGLHLRRVGPKDSRFCRGMERGSLFQAVFPITRFSGSALDLMLVRRVELSEGEMKEFVFPNDEVFSFTTLAQDEAHSIADLADFAPDLISTDTFTPRPGYLLDAFLGDTERTQTNKIYHPTREKAFFCTALADRMAGNFRVSNKFAREIGKLSGEDRAKIAHELGASALKYLEKAARKGSRGKKVKNA